MVSWATVPHVGGVAPGQGGRNEDPRLCAGCLFATLGLVGLAGSADATLIEVGPGGFLGVESSVTFVRAEVTFSNANGRFAFDNLRFEPVPEPATLLLLASGLIGLTRLRRRS
jgi:hypothetical protein